MPKKNYYLFNPGRLSRKDNTVIFTPVNEHGEEQKPKYLPVENIDQLYVYGSLDSNSAILNFLGKNDVAIHYFDYYENYTGSFMPRNKLLAGRMLIAQTKAYINSKTRLTIAKQFIIGAAFNMVKNLNYYNTRGKELEPIIEVINAWQQKIDEATTIPELMGIEGNIRKAYYESFNIILNDHTMDKRTKQPPLNIVNALISFGNMMCYSECLRCIHATQLDPTISYLHEPGERRYSLALDITEIFKPIIIDRVIFKVLNKKEIQDSDFEQSLNKVVLKESGKKKFIAAIESRMNETIKHRTLNRNVSYKQLMKLEAYKLQKHLLKIEEYKPFKMYW